MNACTYLLQTCIHLGSSIRTCPKLWWRAKGWSDTNGCLLRAPTTAGKQGNLSLGGICRQVYEHLQTVLGRRTCWHVLKNLYALNYLFMIVRVSNVMSLGARAPPATFENSHTSVYAQRSFRCNTYTMRSGVISISLWRWTCTFGVSLFLPPLAVSCLATILGELQLLLVVYYIWK